MNYQRKHFPACHVLIPTECEGRRCAFFLAAEEYIADTFKEGNYFFTWQLDSTCVFGRNQMPHIELDIDFCNKNNIDLCRRKSGGGTIFADKNNLMLSLITPSCDVESLFAEYADTIADGLRQLGAPAMVSGRNDIVLKDGKKICGNAFYHLNNRNIVHGTMLYDVDMEKMYRALTPDKAKLESKGVVSVKSRIGKLKDFLPFNIETLRYKLITILTKTSITLTSKDIKTIEEIERNYYDPLYLWGHNAKSDIIHTAHIKECGTIQVGLTLRGSLIESLKFTGDFFENGKDVEAVFNKMFYHVPYTLADIKQIIKTQHPEKLIRNLTSESLLALLYA